MGGEGGGWVKREGMRELGRANLRIVKLHLEIGD